MRKPSLRSVAFLAVLCFIVVGVASANNLNLVSKFSVSPITSANTVNVNVPFPTAGDSYCSATNGCGVLPTGIPDPNTCTNCPFQSTAGDFVISSVFVLPTSSVTDLTANWNFEDFLGNGNTETWYVYINSVLVAQTTLPDDAYNGDILNVSGTVNFAGIGPVGGGYQVELVLQNTVPFGGGSVAWLDGGVTGLSYNVVPEPSSMLLLGSGVIGLAGLLRRKLGK